VFSSAGKGTTDWTDIARSEQGSSALKLVDGSRVAVIGGGPAGSFFSYFLMEMAERLGIDVQVDVYESRDFSKAAPLGCNMCGGIVSESLVQALAAEGISLPPTVVQRGINSYMLHMDVGSVGIETPLKEMRIGAVYRGSGPRGVAENKWESFDGHLQKLVLKKGAELVQGRVDDISRESGKFQVKARGGAPKVYDLLAVAAGINSATLKLFEGLELGYKPPKATRTFIREYFLGQDRVGQTLGSSMHVFLLDIPRLEFAAIIPKGDYVTVCLLGQDIDNSLVQSFMNSPEVRRCLSPEEGSGKGSCQCSPYISVEGAVRPFADRVVFIGDCGVTRLYKDGIGAAYRTAKAAATTAAFQGISAADFDKHYWPICKTINNDNSIGKLSFMATRQIQKRRFARRALFRMTLTEQKKEGRRRRMSMVLWDMFTGSAPYKEVFLRTLHPIFLTRLLWNVAVSVLSFGKGTSER
jgi:flavin-dependent dehydrogenase